MITLNEIDKICDGVFDSKLKKDYTIVILLQSKNKKIRRAQCSESLKVAARISREFYQDYHSHEKAHKVK